MKDMIRSNTCWQCVHCIETKAAEQGYRPQESYCEITKHWGKLDRGRNCTRYEYRQLSKAMGDDAIPIKNRQPLDYRTEKQWQEEGRAIKAGAEGVLMHPSRNTLKVYRYYLIDDTTTADEG